MSRKQRNDYGGFDFDTDLDMDFDFDVPKSRSRKSSKPIDHITEGVSSAIQSKFTDPYHIRNMIRKALPEGFSQAWDAADTLVEDSSQLYDQATKELKPHLSGITRKLDNLVPESMSRTKKFLQTVKDKIAPEIPDSFGNYQNDAQEAGLQRMFAELELQKFQVSDAQRKADQAREVLSERVAGKRFDSQQKLLGVIANSTVSTQRYLTGFNVGYQKKSLELQYRTYAATAGLAKAFGDYAQRNAKFQDALLVNTSLPEYAKTSNIQRWKQVSKQQVFSDINSRLFGSNSRIGAAAARMKKAGKERLAEYKDALSMIEDSLEMAIDARDMDKEFAELEGRSSSGWRTAGSFLGDMGSEVFSDWISGKAKNFASKNKGLMKRSYSAGKYAMNPGSMFDKLKNSKFYKELGNDGSESGEFFKDALSGMMRLFADASPDMTIKNTSIGSSGEDKLNTQMRVARSQIDIIPGYLSRILREMTILRTGNSKVGLLTYDYQSGTFKTESKMAADIMKGLRQKASESRTDMNNYSENIESTYNSFVGDQKLSNEQSTKVKSFLAKLSRSTDDFDVEGGRLKGTKEFKTLDPETKKIVESILDKRYTGSDHDSVARQFYLTKGLAETKRSIGNLMGPIQELIREGHTETLVKNGVISRDKNGDWTVNQEAYYKFFDDTIGTSDVNAKTNIRQGAIDGKKAMNGFKNTNVYSYNYKAGQGLPDGNAYGPMAQDVRSNFGNGAAPGGKSIDFLNLSGYQTAAIKKITEMLESMGGGDGINYLKDISETLRNIQGSGIGGGSPTGYTDFFEHAGAAAGKGVRSLFGAGKKGFSQGKRALGAVGQGASQLFQSEGFKKAQESALSAAMQAATKAVEVGSNLIFNTIPNSIKSGKDLLGAAKDGLVGLVQKAKDVYVQGRESPALEAVLIKAGYYRDQATNTVIRSMKDVLSAKGNIIDPTGNVRLSIEDKARGIFDGAGERIKTLGQKAGQLAMGLGSMAFQGASNALRKIMPAGKAAFNKLGQVGESIGNFAKGLPRFGFGMDPRLLGVVIQIRDLIALDKSGPAVTEILGRDLEKDPTSGILNGGAIKGIIDGVKSGLNDLFGNSLNTEFMGPLPPSAGNSGFVGPMPNGSGAGLGGILGGMGGLFGAGKNLFSSVKNSFRGMRIPGTGGFVGPIPPSSGNDGFVGPMPRGGKFSRLAGFAGRGLNSLGNMASKGLGMFGSLAGLFSGNNDNSQGNQQRTDEDASNGYSAGSHAQRLMQLMGDKASQGYRRVKGMFGDSNGDGQRDGGASDRMSDMNAQRLANEERKQAGIEAARKGSDAKSMRNSPADNAIEKMIGIATQGLSAIAGAAGGLLSGAGDILGGAMDGFSGGRSKGAGKAGKGGRIARTLRGIGGGIQGVLGKIPGSATVARVGTSAVRAAQVVGLMGGGVGAMAGTAATAIGAALSSPLVLGGLAVAGAAYGGYKLYKYLTKNNINDYERIRILQYGLDGTDVTKAYNSKVLALENYILDGKLAFSSGVATINSRAADPNDIRELFDIPQDDAELSRKFAAWYEYRFRPVFLKHVNSLFRADRKANLKDVGSVPAPQLLEYLSGIEVDASVWTQTISPFKGLDALSNNPGPARTLINAKTKEVSEKVNKKAKEAVKAGDIAPKGDAAKAAETKITSAVPALKAVNTGTVLPPAPNPSIPKNSRLAAAMASGAVMQNGLSEDGPGADRGGAQSSSTLNYSGNTGNLKGAGGPLADGSQGMQYIKLGKDATIDGLNPAFKKQFLAMAQEYGQQTGKSILVNEAFRSYARQEQLWRQHPGKAARPGGSMHEFGLAVDINTSIMNELEKLGLLRKYGFTRPIVGETWHMEPAGVQLDIRKAKADPQWAARMIAESVGRGGGGAGSTPNSKKGGRNPALAKSIFESSSSLAINGQDTTTGTGTDVIASSQGAASKGRGQGVTSSAGADFSGSLGGSKSEIKSQIAKYSMEAGADPNEMMLMAAMESGLDPNAKAKTSSAKGLNQFIDGTWNEQMSKHGSKYGISGASQMDPRASTILAAEYMKSNNDRLYKAKGSPLDMTDKYMGHMFGAGGASSLMRADPNSIAAAVLPAAAKSNRSIFFDGGRPRTVAEVKQLLEGRLKKKANDFGIQFPGSGANAYNVPGTSVSSLSENKIAYTPTQGVSKPLSPNSIAGYDIPNYSPTMFTANKDSSTKAVGVGFEAPNVNRVPRVSSMNGAMGSSRDTSFQVTGELFDRLQSSADEQITHLSVISDSSVKMVKLLETIVDNTSKEAILSGTSSESSPGKSIPPANPSRPQHRAASSSSFDNRRLIATA